MMDRRHWSRLVLAGLSMGLGACSPGETATEAAHPWVGRQLWETLALQDTAGRPVGLPAASGRPQLINFWALWCGPCREELPALVRLQQDHASVGLDVLGVALSDNPLAVSEYLALRAPMFRSFLIHPLDGEVDRLKLSALPVTMLLSASGQLMQHWLGARDWDRAEVRAQLVRALGIPSKS